MPAKEAFITITSSNNKSQINTHKRGFLEHAHPLRPDPTRERTPPPVSNEAHDLPGWLPTALERTLERNLRDYVGPPRVVIGHEDVLLLLEHVGVVAAVDFLVRHEALRQELRRASVTHRVACKGETKGCVRTQNKSAGHSFCI